MYLGTQPTSAAYVTDTFSGTGSQTDYTMSVAPASTSSMLVVISGVMQDPSTYAIVGMTLRFSAAPPSGTGNISVRYLGIPAAGVVNTAYRTVTDFTATAGQTTWTVPSYTPGFIDVFRNGVRLGNTDFTATNGTSITLALAANANDLITTVSFSVSSVLNAIPATPGSVIDNYINTVSASKMTGSRTLPQGVIPAGHVLQVVQAYVGGQVTISSGSWVDTGLSASITLTSSTSKVLVLAQQNGVFRGPTAGSFASFMLTRGTTDLMQFGYVVGYDGNAVYQGAVANCAWLDSPNTVASITYKTRMAQVGGGQTDLQRDASAISTITLMEIAA
jgi:hypothetical protein